MNELDLAGRLVPVTAEQQRGWANEPGIQLTPALQVLSTVIHCNRCHNDCEKEVSQLPTGDYYCRNCINLGRLDSSMALATRAEPNAFQVAATPVLAWVGKLTPDQQSCAAQIRQGFQTHQSQLLWAVTGAGKTEISFVGIAWALEQGLRVAIASPRVDVCLELFPRYQAAFPTIPMVLLHGQQQTPYSYRQLTICTTHQLLRFQAAFDVLILDEVDAFPYAGNPTLAMATQRAVKPQGALLLMTATPSRQLQREYRGRIAYLPRRFHGFPLPQLRWRLAYRWRHQLDRGRLPRILKRLVQQKVQAQQPFLLFVPRIRDLAVIDGYLAKWFENRVQWETVYAGDEARIAKVNKMRQREVLFLVTTTILERGVTFPGIDVIILGGDDRVFSVASLVQMAGRVGRKATRPTGTVDCIVAAYTTNVIQARHQIAQMNRRAHSHA
ncbi:DEAD/DEAH box helicase family protein [Fructilactobacillus myrtifloralis]|uniref:DEAD/DEAH box helicase family protein n=1 Tax=Fructilactobacillus myrtifloralis TaxID=2940301 RepID=A0ABY5BMY1_9LACO|nr:helicase-related protein [Fructilactobacillus myrtifloralis]USS84950.1 DEAD/DEAH box helicase family protein [Fructilactobacillus myrtifloralis]